MPVLQIVVAHRSRRPAVVSESVHPDGREHQVDLECGSRDLRGGLAAKRVWTVSFHVANSRRIANRKSRY